MDVREVAEMRPNILMEMLSQSPIIFGFLSFANSPWPVHKACTGANHAMVDSHNHKA